ncbi:hypothetical protein GCM10022286_03590 [Gryllotalpicola daejeonensis]|uniref:Uncharacterized protein n=1 Tax=Gryllotalpicola daejeonensis TaxID=993087 RepID=A0ABP7ZEF3_9MICO
MQLVDVAAIALPQFCQALQAGLRAAASVSPSLSEVAVTDIVCASDRAADGDNFYCSAEVPGESLLVSYVHGPHLGEPERLYAHFASDIADWIAESHFGWGIKVE